MHIQGYFRNQLNSRQRGELRDVILHYRDGLLPILAPLTLLKHYLAEYPDRYLMTQNYFDPILMIWVCVWPLPDKKEAKALLTHRGPKQYPV